MNTRGRIAALVAVIVIAVVAFVVLKPDDKKTTSQSVSTTNAAPTTQPAAPVQVNVKGGKPVGGIKEIDASKGDRVQFVVHSDVSDEIHVHGYDFMKDVKAG